MAFWLLALLFLSVPYTYAQTPLVTGKVVDTTGAPVAGASIIIKGVANKGAHSGNDGTFSIPAGQSDVLLVRYLGYQSMEIPITSSRLPDIVLRLSNSTLSDVVVVGYGTQKKTTLTGAVEQVSSKAFQDRAVTNVGLALQGQTPGLVVTRSSPRPGNEGIAFQIRGATSVNGGSPLIVIDGVPALHSSALQQMNPDDIESVSVLKDGAAAIYGSRAANGVILVTTKRGKGKLQVEYSNNLRFTTNGIAGYSPTMEEYATVWLEANKEETIPNWWGWVSKENMEKMQQGVEDVYQTQFWDDVYLGHGNRIQELFTRKYSHQHNLSIANRNDITGYRLSFAYADNRGNLATAYDGQKQYNLRFNYDYKLSDRIKLESGITLQNVVTSSPSSGLDATMFAYDMPFFPSRNPLGQWNANFGNVGNRNAVAATTDGGRDDQVGTLGRLDLKGTVNLLEGLDFEGMASFQGDQYRREKYVNPVQLYDWYGNKAREALSSTVQNTGNPGYATTSNATFYQYYSALLRYSRSFGGVHNFSALAGINAEKYQYKYLQAYRVNFTDQGVYDLNAATTDVMGNSGGKNQTGYYSYIARLNYNYKEKYLLELLGRRDGSSKFDVGYKWKHFGTVSAGWVFTSEKFMPAIPGLNFGKIRASYGVSGNNVGIGSYDYVSTVSNSTVALGYPVGLQGASSLANNGLVSRERTWERVYQQNIGIDLAFLNSRLTATFDYFQKDNKGMLVNVQYPAVLGGAAPKSNSGHLNVKGWELMVGWKDQKGDFAYNVSFNISNNKTLLKNMEGADAYGPGKNNTVNGYPLYSWFLYQTSGYFASQQEVDAYYEAHGGNAGLLGAVQGNNALRPGDTRRIDHNGDGVVSNTYDASKKVASDVKFMGDAAPHYVFGLNMGGSWKGLDFNAFFQGVGQQYIMRSGYMAFPFNVIWSNQNVAYIGKTWTEENPNAQYPRLTVYTNRARWNYENNDFMLQNSRYLRLKALVIGYTLPQQLTQKARLERVRLYFSGNDLWEWTSIKDGYDPEHGETTQNAGYPFYRTWSFGINVGL
ncbi:TonB-dependent receptor [Chitinophaga japonensis]